MILISRTGSGPSLRSSRIAQLRRPGVIAIETFACSRLEHGPRANPVLEKLTALGESVGQSLYARRRDSTQTIVSRSSRGRRRRLLDHEYEAAEHSNCANFPTTVIRAPFVRCPSGRVKAHGRSAEMTRAHQIPDNTTLCHRSTPGRSSDFGTGRSLACLCSGRPDLGACPFNRSAGSSLRRS